MRKWEKGMIKNQMWVTLDWVKGMTGINTTGTCLKQTPSSREIL